MVKEFYRKYEKYLSFVAFFTGFTIDNITLTRIDLWLDNLILGSYLIIAAFGITSYQAFNRKLIKGKGTKRMLFLLTLMIQFAFGGLFSGYFVFYSKSASLVTSWWFVLLIIFMLIANELFKEKYERLEFQVSVYFVTVFSFAIFYVPILLNKMGAWVFVLSGLVSLVLIRIFIQFLSLVAKAEVKKAKRTLTGSILSIYILFNIFYFTNVIPPIPLSLKEASVHHSIVREGSVYRATTEHTDWYDIPSWFRDTIHTTDSSTVVVYTSVFAPTDLSVDVFHSWQYYNDLTGDWIESDRFSYPIAGGRDGGYRGYTTKNSTFPAKWRVDIVTNRGQIIGRVRFNIVNDEQTPTIVQEILR